MNFNSALIFIMLFLWSVSGLILLKINRNVETIDSKIEAIHFNLNEIKKEAF
jgi:hypothetical protein